MIVWELFGITQGSYYHKNTVIALIGQNLFFFYLPIQIRRSLTNSSKSSIFLFRKSIRRYIAMSFINCYNILHNMLYYDSCYTVFQGDWKRGIFRTILHLKSRQIFVYLNRILQEKQKQKNVELFISRLFGLLWKSIFDIFIKTMSTNHVNFYTFHVSVY